MSATVLVVVGADCPHCRVVLAGLRPLVEEGIITAMEILQADQHPERVAQLGIRSVPWLRLGPFELEGALPPGELRLWASRAGSMQGMAAYFDHLFSRGQRQRVEAMVRQQPAWLAALVLLLADEQVGINSRLGVGVVLEEVADSGIASRIVHDLGEITRSPQARLRGDACHYLPLTRCPAALPYLADRFDDPHPEVREIAHESWETLHNALAGEQLIF